MYDWTRPAIRRASSITVKTPARPLPSVGVWTARRKKPLWYRQRGEVSENGIKELKIGFGMERMPCGQFAANAAFFRIGVIAHNLFVLFKRSALGTDWQHHKVATVRWRLLHLPGKVVRHAGAWVLKVASEVVDLFRSIRARSFALAQAMSP